MSNKIKAIGEAVNRIDGFLKVTGRARYALDFPVAQAAYGYLLKSEIAAGKIEAIDTREAEKADGVIGIVTHRNALKLTPSRSLRGGAVLQDDEIKYYGENIGVVVAETYEQARHAARLVRFRYAKSGDAQTDFEELMPSARPSAARGDEVRGDADKAFREAAFRIDETYETPIEHHHTMAPHATIAVWDAPDKLTVYNESQIVNGVQGAVAATFGLARENVRVISPHIGGGFGSKGGAWSHVVLAAMAAKMFERPVRLALTRQMMFNSVGLRQRNVQRIRLSADRDGKLSSLVHETTTHTAIDSEFVEPCGDVSEHMYRTPNLRVAYRVVPLNVILPTYTRAPGKSTGSFALESAIDELAFKLKMDPIELRIRNEPDRDPTSGKPFSSRSLVEALRRGAEVFGWKNRRMEPGSVKEGDEWIGRGVACGTYPARQWNTSALVRLERTGDEVKAGIRLAASDLGTGTYTIIAQVAAETLGLPVGSIGVVIGDSELPPAAGSVGSVGAASFSNAVYEGCLKALRELQARSNVDWFAPPTVLQLMRAANLNEFETRVDSTPLEISGDYECHAFTANFAQVRVNGSTGMVRVTRFVSATGAGRILNPKTAESQMHGGAIWGIGQALTEESEIDPRWGNFVTRTLADYHIPSNLDIGDMEVIFIPEEDRYVNGLGVKGIGEVGIVGVAAAVANAIFNATGKRVRDLPITPDKLV